MARLMEHFFTPWRMEYIQGKREQGCVFCKAPTETNALRERLVLHVGERSFVILNRFPYNSGHLMVIPLRHTCDFAGLDPLELSEMDLLLRHSVDALSRAYKPEGFNLGMNLGASAGAGIREHLHWHVVPRWIGDTNFMPVLAETRAIPEHLVGTFDRLLPHFRTPHPESPLGRAGKERAP